MARPVDDGQPPSTVDERPERRAVEEVGDPVERDRRSEQEPLGPSAAEHGEHRELLLGFHPFGDDVEPEVVGEREDRRGDRGVAAVVVRCAR